MLQDREVLEQLQVTLAPQPLRHPAPLGAALGMRVLARLDWLQLPRLVQTAADMTSNRSACFLCASVCEARCAAAPPPLSARHMLPA